MANTKPKRNEVQEKLSFTQKLQDWIISPAGIMFFIGCGLLIVSMVTAYLLQTYSSDNVIWQNALLSWRPFHGTTYYADATASYIAKVPLYWVMMHVMSAGRRLLFVEGVILSLGNFVLFYWALMYFWRKWGIGKNWRNLLPVVWLTSLGFGMSTLFLATNLHNIEAGAIFVAFVLTAKILYGEIHPFGSWRAILVSIVATAFFGVMLVDDHYTLYFGAAPIVLLLAYKWYVSASSNWVLGQLVGLLVLSELWAKIIEKILTKAGIVLLTGIDGNFVSMQALGTGIKASVEGMFAMFGGDFWGRQLSAHSTLLALSGSLLVVVIALLVYRLVRHQIVGASDEKEYHLGPQFFAMLFFFAIIVYTLSGLAVDASTYRYFIMLPFVAVLLLPYAFSSLSTKGRYVLTALLIVAALSNLAGSIGGVKNPTLASEYSGQVTNPKNSMNIATIKTIESLHLQKGYGAYWQANINSYLSNGKLNVLPTACTDGITSEYYWLIDRGQFAKKATRSFYIYDPIEQNMYGCTMPLLAKQFGQPVKQVPLEDGETLLVYSYDITPRMGPQ